ncbi:hypothetical protein [Sporolactobacillus terrae]|uniref:hypothetical protein n=1 Tax=Sporolactobacillus terrae TaxID=269673 RepID=UPI001119F0A0|nr:hypothetical protein [Sporolactobacillus terrae]
MQVVTSFLLEIKDTFLKFMTPIQNPLLQLPDMFWKLSIPTITWLIAVYTFTYREQKEAKIFGTNTEHYKKLVITLIFSVLVLWSLFKPNLKYGLALISYDLLVLVYFVCFVDLFLSFFNNLNYHVVVKKNITLAEKNISRIIKHCTKPRVHYFFRWKISEVKEKYFKPEFNNLNRTFSNIFLGIDKITPYTDRYDFIYNDLEKLFLHYDTKNVIHSFLDEIFPRKSLIFSDANEEVLRVAMRCVSSIGNHCGKVIITSIANRNETSSRKLCSILILMLERIKTMASSEEYDNNERFMKLYNDSIMSFVKKINFHDEDEVYNIIKCFNESARVFECDKENFSFYWLTITDIYKSILFETIFQKEDQVFYSILYKIKVNIESNLGKSTNASSGFSNMLHITTTKSHMLKLVIVLLIKSIEISRFSTSGILIRFIVMNYSDENISSLFDINCNDIEYRILDKYRFKTTAFNYCVEKANLLLCLTQYYHCMKNVNKDIPISKSTISLLDSYSSEFYYLLEKLEKNKSEYGLVVLNNDKEIENFHKTYFPHFIQTDKLETETEFIPIK